MIRTEDYKDYVIEYIEEYQKGNINDIIRYLIEKNILIQNLAKFKELIEKILKELTTHKKINYSPTTQNFLSKTAPKLEYYPIKNELISYQNFISGQIINYTDESFLNFESLNEVLLNSLESLGTYECISVDNKKNILIATFKSSLIQTHLNITNDTFSIRSQMKPLITESEPIILYISNLNKTLKKEKCTYIPLNYGIYLIYEIILDFIKKNYKNLDLKINFLEFKE